MPALLSTTAQKEWLDVGVSGIGHRPTHASRDMDDGPRFASADLGGDQEGLDPRHGSKAAHHADASGIEAVALCPGDDRVVAAGPE